ncbi:DUF3313 domain-containing protein [Polynucleobacter arcticus]|uniref:DUF3313 domain-containing protein n=1 Tax=Polynucleobacter arcticus TaxID=1743165 RepID=A0A6M9PNM9_9BURK|nr:DUF3313 domain-containing protein [Polynucleobacter arcticus]QKM61492.1 DUF3313 domain-containing protein [Polynucleobacter arcticus]
MNRRHILTISLFVPVALLIAACSNTSKYLTEPMPQSGFLPNYKLLQLVTDSPADSRVWRYRDPAVDPNKYTSVILDPVYLNQTATQQISAQTLAQVKEVLQYSMVDAINARGNIKIVNNPGPGVAKLAVGITGAEMSNNSLQPWNFTPIGLATNAAAYVAGVNAKTPALIIESKITDSQSGQILGEGLITIQGESFRTGSGSVEAFTNIAKKAVREALMLSARR